MFKHRLSLAIGLFALILSSNTLHAQLLGKGKLPIDIPQPMADITKSLQRDIRLQHQTFAPELETGADALLDNLPDANTLATDTLAIDVRNKQQQTALTEVYVTHGWRALQHEWLVLLEENQLATLRSLPVTILSEANLPHLQMLTVRIRVKDKQDQIAAVKTLLVNLGAEIIERHHVYDVQSSPIFKPETPEKEPIHHSSQLKKATGDIRIGVIDTAFDRQHAGLKSVTIHSQSFVQSDMNEPVAHGTAVLGRLFGKSAAVKPLLPDAQVFAASVFYQKDAYSQSAPTLALLKALDWMLEKNVSVINMSLAGPPNALLEKAIQRVRSQGTAIVAASGNAGPASRPLFPAAYPSVIAVSAVDEHRRIYRWANRGKHIDFVAIGVNVTTLRAGGGEGRESGTSMAAPVISAALALRMQSANMEDSLAELFKDTVDLGKPGRDVIFGQGLIEWNP